ncbi:hypothetical protein C8R47DRAFT_643828 [Mycena vitilis]|nr:hypothetical protein C8R47DRAFT_643828 [Mycena vitilis]
MESKDTKPFPKTEPIKPDAGGTLKADPCATAAQALEHAQRALIAAHAALATTKLHMVPASVAQELRDEITTLKTAAERDRTTIADLQKAAEVHDAFRGETTAQVAALRATLAQERKQHAEERESVANERASLEAEKQALLEERHLIAQNLHRMSRDVQSNTRSPGAASTPLAANTTGPVERPNAATDLDPPSSRKRQRTETILTATCGAISRTTRDLGLRGGRRIWSPHPLRISSFLFRFSPESQFSPYRR